ncbi:MAG TPA: hypothetical protein VFA17_05925 [Thermoplasmata archaeon]|nr:hypothetical protein [Thermoplasmata archaeon]
MDSLAASRCAGCEAVSQPRRARCRQCGGRTFEGVELRQGRLLSFTRVTVTRPDHPASMLLGLAEFEHGVKLLARVDDPSPELEMGVRPKWLRAPVEGRDGTADVVLVRS